MYFFSNSLSRKNNGKIFWLKKSFRKPVVNNNTDEDLKLWPRKKANVTFANELFIDDIHDLNEDSSNSKQSNFISDFNDMYKFTLISPRRNRRSKSWKWLNKSILWTDEKLHPCILYFNFLRIYIIYSSTNQCTIWEWDNILFFSVSTILFLT